ncbi:Actin patch protein 1 [Fusarium austroafricanum]|uniref:Actin patch protein 1 n=1 Tax=Fusarium austroafricanum TaxID=2364996 RepID=A0A8H4KTD5_9HYPO|nr:Actin patch protein 1 [Fusarium austroafricanum]
MLKVAFLGFLPVVVAIPAAVPGPAPTVYQRAAVPAAQPTEVMALDRRGIIDDAESYVDSLVSGVETKIKGWVNSGILDFPTGFPTGDAVKKSAGVDDDDLKAEPTQVLNIPPYANWTNKGWNVRVHGNVYKFPNLSQKKVDDLANIFLVDTSVEDLPKSQQEQARNVTRSIFVVQQGDVEVKMNFVNNVDVSPDESGGAIDARGGAQNITLPYSTTIEGDFDTFVTLKNTSGPNNGYLIPGNETSKIQALNLYAEGKNNSGNATAYLVPPKGITIVNDIDDILRVTKIYQPKEGLLNTFARPFTPWMNMPDVYANWSSSIKDLHFHYLTTTPEQATRNYMSFIYNTYPLGSFDTRPLNFSDVSATLSIRRFLLDKIFQTFPERKFILVADTSNSDVMKDYPAMYKDYPGQVQCILLRNTSSTDSGDRFPYNTKGFKDIPQKNYMFFHVPDDIAKIDIANGGCYNSSIKQNVTFDYQGLPFGLSDDNNAAAGGATPRLGMVIAVLIAAGLAIMV